MLSEHQIGCKMTIFEPESLTPDHRLLSTSIETPIGKLFAIADLNYLYYLGFMEPKERPKQRLRYLEKAAITHSKNTVLHEVEEALKTYFSGKKLTFSLPLGLFGTPFQKQVWRALAEIPFGETRSYEAVAQAIGRPTACRAVARANATNPIAIVIPCHRVINKSGNLGGYDGGVARKQWLLQHESQ